jgi:ubiquinone/menaquinone biosynthesis C-methylase UbiE
MNSSKRDYVIDAEHPTETARLITQSQLFTQAMHGFFPADMDLSGVRRVLDLGCGPGKWADDVAFLYPEWQIVGVDINETMIRYARAIARSQGRPNVTFKVMDLTQPFTFVDASFDLIYARFIVGFQDKASWPVLLSECRRVLSPGGVLLLNEAEQGISSSPALQRLQGWLARALYEQGRTFSVDGQTIGIVHMLKHLLAQADFVELEQRPFLLDASIDAPLYASSFREFEITYSLLRPYLLGSGVVDAQTYDRTYQWMLIETQQDDFRCLAFGVSAWGSKRLEEPINEGARQAL